MLTSIEDVTAGQAEREKPKRMETARKVGKEEHRSMIRGLIAPYRGQHNLTGTVE